MKYILNMDGKQREGTDANGYPYNKCYTRAYPIFPRIGNENVEQRQDGKPRAIPGEQKCFLAFTTRDIKPQAVAMKGVPRNASEKSVDEGHLYFKSPIKANNPELKMWGGRHIRTDNTEGSNTGLDQDMYNSPGWSVAALAAGIVEDKKTSENTISNLGAFNIPVSEHLQIEGIDGTPYRIHLMSLSQQADYAMGYPVTELSWGKTNYDPDPGDIAAHYNDPKNAGFLCVHAHKGNFIAIVPYKVETNQYDQKSWTYEIKTTADCGKTPWVHQGYYFLASSLESFAGYTQTGYAIGYSNFAIAVASQGHAVVKYYPTADFGTEVIRTINAGDWTLSPGWKIALPPSYDEDGNPLPIQYEYWDLISQEMYGDFNTGSFPLKGYAIGNKLYFIFYCTGKYKQRKASTTVNSNVWVYYNATDDVALPTGITGGGEGSGGGTGNSYAFPTPGYCVQISETEALCTSTVRDWDYYSNAPMSVLIMNEPDETTGGYNIPPVTVNGVTYVYNYSGSSYSNPPAFPQIIRKESDDSIWCSFTLFDKDPTGPESADSKMRSVIYRKLPDKDFEVACIVGDQDRTFPLDWSRKYLLIDYLPLGNGYGSPCPDIAHPPLLVIVNPETYKTGIKSYNKPFNHILLQWLPESEDKDGNIKNEGYYPFTMPTLNQPGWADAVNGYMISPRDVTLSPDDRYYLPPPE